MRLRNAPRLTIWLTGCLVAFLSTPGGMHAQQQIMLGQSVVALNGPWKFHIGDNPQWADPNFNDSQWETMVLTPKAGALDPVTGLSNYVPGWTAKGHPGYWGYAWYRIRVDIVQQRASGGTHGGRQALSIGMPNNFDDAYQLYVNGKLTGQFGRFTKSGAVSYFSEPRAFPLSASIGGPITVAIRMWMDPSTASRRDAGGLHGVPVLGQTSVVDLLLRLDWDAILRKQAGIILSLPIDLLALVVAFGLFWLDRREPAYFWLGIVCTSRVLFGAVYLLGSYTRWTSGAAVSLLLGAILNPLSYGLWVLFWGYWFRVGRMTRHHRMVWGVAFLLGAATAMQQAPLSGRVVPIHTLSWLAPLTLALKLLLGTFLVWVTYRGIRKDRIEGWLAVPAVLLVAMAIFWQELPTLHVPQGFSPFGVFLPVGLIADYICLEIVLVLLLRRFLQGQRERERIRTELQQARSVQEMMIPTRPPQALGFTVESVYIPASEVGGDFFQIIPGDDGSLLIVVGDVSGKGLKAAMTVSTVVGALRDYSTRGPSDILAHLNRVLHGQITGFATCCAALVSADGTLTIANAGHLSPYRNGEELAVEPGLPLGVIAKGDYAETEFQLAPGDRFTFISDGVVEATNEKRELFGFERTQAISNQPAQRIAEAAKTFGQEDDITVLSVTRTTNLKAVTA